MKCYVAIYDLDDNIICTKYVKANTPEIAVSRVMLYCMDELGYSRESIGMVLCDWSHKCWF